jgi:hypothetical protein
MGLTSWLLAEKNLPGTNALAYFEKKNLPDGSNDKELILFWMRATPESLASML